MLTRTSARYNSDMSNEEPIRVISINTHIRKHPDFTGCLIDKDNDVFWYKNGKRHRTDGPAIECANGDKWWYKNGEYHRENGPAIECATGSKRWYLNGEILTEQEHRIAVRQMKLKMLDTIQHSL